MAVTKQTVLIADDDADLRNMYSTKFESSGYAVVGACDGDDCLAKMKTAKPDIVILDLMMPKKDGFMVLEIAKQDKAIKDIPIIVLSALGQKEDADLARNLGAAEFYIKPQTMLNELVAKAEQYLK